MYEEWLPNLMLDINAWLIQLSAYINAFGYYTALVYVLIFYIALELFIPLFLARQPLIKRWRVNFSLSLFNSLFIYGLYTLLSGFFVLEYHDSPFGLFYWLPDISFTTQFILFFLVRDLLSYGSHRLLHNWRPLWRLHLVHHTDLDIDVATTVRHHPLESLYAAMVSLLTIALMGATLPLLILCDLLQIVWDFYTHANIKLPRFFERIIRVVFVTSDMHRIHHSALRCETNSNYGSFFSFWDRLFGTYRFAEWEEQRAMTWGLEYFRKERDQSLIGVLSQPFRYTVNQRSSNRD